MPGKGKEIPVFMYDPDNRVYHVIVGLKNKPGALADLFRRLSESQMNVVSISASAGLKNDVATASFFAESVGKPPPDAELRTLVSSSEFAVTAEVSAVDGGILFDIGTFPITFNNGQRVMLLSHRTFAQMLNRARSLYGAIGEALVFEQGLTAGREEWHDLEKTLGREKAFANAPELVHLYEALGWARPEIVEWELEPFNATLRLYDSMECTGQSSAKPYSQFLRGHVAGVVESAFGFPARCAEVECVAKSDPYCQFEIRRE